MYIGQLQLKTCNNLLFIPIANKYINIYIYYNSKHELKTNLKYNKIKYKI